MNEYHLDWWRIAEEQRMAQKARRRAKIRAAIEWSAVVVILAASVAMWAEFVHICKKTKPLYATEITNNNNNQ
ncbi:MAG: hypothetical protein MJZ90_10315 [Bacteroidales bacterium]|nr:hypothetical protein [Bacteroidales bacterium]